jgi:Glycosyl hydrolase family 71
MANRVSARTAIVMCILCFSAMSGCDSSDSDKTSASTSSAPAATSPAPAIITPAPKAPATTPTTPKTAPAPTTPASSTVVTNFTGVDDACVALTMPSADALFASTKKVFAHYFFPFPVSLDNSPPVSDYYNTQYLTKDGESGKWLAQGGYLRQRPLGTTPGTRSSWQLLNMQAEVRAAIARGITGFAFDVMSVSEATGSDSPLQLLMTAAHAVDSRFKIMVMPDITSLGSNSSAVIQIIAAVANNPAAYRLADGRLVASAFDASLNSVGWWTAVLNQLSSQGIKVAFVPTFLSWANSAAAFAPISYGIADWGTATATVATQTIGDAETVHSMYGKIFMTPVDPQQFRPKDFLYWEAGNSSAFRNAWMSSIDGAADWVQLVTWNDFSESGQISPYTDTSLRGDIGTGYYNLTGYYAAWFLTGQQPAITHDVLHYFYRREPSTAAGPAQSQRDTSVTGETEDDIELVAFLTAPAALKITIGGKTYTHNAAAGVVSFKIPSQPGVPLFTLSRNGADVFSFEGGIQIYGASGLPSGVQDLTYWSGSAAKSGICSL